MLGEGNGADLMMSTSEGNGVETHILDDQITKKVRFKDTHADSDKSRDMDFSNE